METKQSEPIVTFRSCHYFPALDGLRAICVALVMFNHTHTPYPHQIKGWLGVDIFYVLSGFLITTLLLREREKYGNVSFKGFYVRRFFRIIPVYMAVLAVYIPVIRLMHDHVRWAELKIALPYLLTFTQEFRPAASGTVFGHSWTLGYEEKFYLVWPLLLIALCAFRKLLIPALCALSCIILMAPAQTTRSYGGLFLGSLLAISLARENGGRIQKLLLQISPLGAIAIMAVGYVCVSYQPRLVLLFSMGACALTASLVLRPSRIRRIFENRVLVLFGKRSYAMYLVHALALNFTEMIAPKVHLLQWYVVIPSAYLLSFAASTGLYYLIERPCIEFGRALSRKIRRGIAQPAAEPLPA